jgi:GGDEF domain-containing protein
MNPRSAERLVRAARAAQALSETLWEALHEELADPMQRRVAELSRRLTDVSATVALLARPEPAEPAGETPPAASARSQASRASAVHDDERPGPAEKTPSPEPTTPPGSGLRHEPSSPRESSAMRSPARGSSSGAVLVDERARDAPLPDAPVAAPEPSARAVREIEIRDERHEDIHPGRAHGVDEPGPWIGAIERRLERHERDRAPFAVLVVELVDVERLRHTELPGEMSRLMGLVEAALSEELRPADSLTRESPGRYWLLAPDTDASGARALVARLASAVRGAASHGGAPLEIAVGIAACPGEGAQAAALAAHAEVALYAARAAGKPVA